MVRLFLEQQTFIIAYNACKLIRSSYHRLITLAKLHTLESLRFPRLSNEDRGMIEEG